MIKVELYVELYKEHHKYSIYQFQQKKFVFPKKAPKDFPNRLGAELYVLNILTDFLVLACKKPFKKKVNLKKFRYEITKFDSLETLKNIFLRKPRAFLYALKEGFPGEKLDIIGVTGTKGKTSTSYIIHQILSSEFKTALISTIEAKIENEKIDTGLHVTSPESNQIHKILKKCLNYGIKKVILEVTSHGLYQKRAEFLNFKTAVFTNIAEDHLDYHGTFEKYLDAKSILFKKKSVKNSVLNKDDKKSFEHLSKVSAGKVFSYSLEDEKADVFAEIIDYSIKGTKIKATIFGKEICEIFIPVPGKFYISNSLAGILVGKIYGVGNDEIKKSIESFTGVPGRMEKIDEGQNFYVFVDFAHTPESLRALLQSVKEFKERNSRIITVFGNAGERDKNRRKMGGVSAELSDITILTAEDPRSEPVEEIMKEAEKYALENGAKLNENLFKEKDRRKAIRMAFEMAKENDIVIITGKGHEQSMNLGKKEEWWDDRVVAMEELKKSKSKSF